MKVHVCEQNDVNLNIAEETNDISTQETKEFITGATTVNFSANNERELEEKRNIAVKKADHRQHNTYRIPFYKLFSYADSVDHALMFVGVIAAAGTGSSVPIMSIIFGEVVDSFGGTTNHIDKGEIPEVCLEFACLALASFVASFLQMTCWIVTGQRQAARIRKLYLKATLRQDIGFFDTQTSIGEIIGRMSGDSVLIQDAMGEKVGQFILFVVAFLGSFVVAFIKGRHLTLILLSCIPPLILAAALTSIFIAKLASRGQDAYSEAATVLEQTIIAIRTVASFTGEKLAISKYLQSITKAYKIGLQQGLATGFLTGIVAFVAFCSCSLAASYGRKILLHKGYTGGHITTVISAIVHGSVSLGMAAPCLNVFRAGQAAAFKMFKVIEREPLVDVYDSRGKELDDIRGDIELKGVYFSYPAMPDDQILSRFSLSIPSGTTAALVGKSGSGKSTVVNLIERFYDPQVGEVLIDGINLKEFQLKWIRKKIGLVSQETVLFNASIKFNICCGKESATDEEIRAAVELAFADIFIDKLPEGLETVVGEHGTQLSEGEKRRIAIARTILKDPRILLLDEAINTLDAESDRLAQESLDKIMINRTTVVVAHRLSTARNADKIAVIHQGEVVEKGSHVELIKDADGAYSRLVRLQQTNIAKNAVGDENSPEVEINYRTVFDQFNYLLDSESRSKGSCENGNNNSSTISNGMSTAVRATETLSADLQTSKLASLRPHQESPLYRLAYLNKPEVPILILAILAAIANGAVLPVFGLFFSKVIRTFYEPIENLEKDSKIWTKYFLFHASASLVLYTLRNYLFGAAGHGLIRRINRMCFEKVIHMQISWFDEVGHSTGEIGAMLSSNAATIRGFVGDAFGLLVQNASSAIIGLVIAFIANWKLALIFLASLLVLGISVYVQLEVIKGFSLNAKKSNMEAIQVASNAVGSIRTVASFCAEEKMLDLYHMKCEGSIKTGLKQGLTCGVGFGLSNFLLYALYSLTFYAAARLVDEGKATFSAVFLVFFGLTLAALSVSHSGSLIPNTIKGKTSAASIFVILDQKSKIDSSDESGVTLENVKGDLEFSDVSFSYPARPDKYTFEHMCLAVPSGKSIALVGESGSGKSTVISLLQRFYDPNSGKITLDGIDIRKLQLKWLRQQMGLVTHKPVLFNDTIGANIAYGKGGNATEAEILEAAKLANAHNFISALKDGYNTVIGDGGVQLSEGQNQRVVIARAILKNPKILLLDEATSALDAESENIVQEALQDFMVDRTTIVVAHRLSTIKGVDMIAVVRNGVIAEIGSFQAASSLKWEARNFNPNQHGKEMKTVTVDHEGRFLPLVIRDKGRERIFGCSS